LPTASPLWAIENVLITPQIAGETCRYEEILLAIIREDPARLWRGETELLNQVVYDRTYGRCRLAVPASAFSNSGRGAGVESDQADDTALYTPLPNWP
jgi:hypothetical protein